MARFIAKNFHHIAVSIDGYPHYNDKSRKYYNGLGSFPDIINGISNLNKYLKKPLDHYQGTISDSYDIDGEAIQEMIYYGFKRARLGVNLLGISEEVARKLARVHLEIIYGSIKNKLKVSDTFTSMFSALIKKSPNLNSGYLFCNGLSKAAGKSLNYNVGSNSLNLLCSYIPNISQEVDLASFNIYNPAIFKKAFYFIWERYNTLMTKCLNCDVIGICRSGCVMGGIDAFNHVNQAACAYNHELWKSFFGEDDKMNKLIAFCLFFLFLIGIVSLCSQDKLTERVFLLEPDPRFGEENLPGLRFNTPGLYMDITEKGELIVSSSYEHCLYIFDAAGNRIGVYGRKGEGPGDLLYPHDVSAFGDQIMVADQAIRKKISIFDLQGRLISVYSLPHGVAKLSWFNNDIIAYAWRRTITEQSTSRRIERNSVYLFNLRTKKEIEIATFDFPAPEVVIKLQNRILTVSVPGRPFGDVFIAGTPRQTVLVGSSAEETIAEFDSIGNVIRSFNHNLTQEPFPVELRDFYLKGIAIPRADEQSMKEFRIQFQQQIVLPKYLPYYHSFWMDREGVFYLFESQGCTAECPESCLVFTPSFTPKEKWRISSKKPYTVNLESVSSSGQFRVFQKNLYLLVVEEIEEESVMRLIKMPVNRKEGHVMNYSATGKPQEE